MEFRGGERERERAVMQPHKTQNMNLYGVWVCFTLGIFLSFHIYLFFSFLSIIGGFLLFKVEDFVVTYVVDIIHSPVFSFPSPSP